jgi:hypothetical protein
MGAKTAIPVLYRYWSLVNMNWPLHRCCCSNEKQHKVNTGIDARLSRESEGQLGCWTLT